MSPGLSHKTHIIDLYLKGYQFTEIEVKTNHSESSVLRYLRHFAQVIQLYDKGFEVGQIRIITGFSDKLIAEYLELVKQYQQSDQLQQLLNPATPAKKNKGVNQ
jgi:hypothetical protein